MISSCVCVVFKNVCAQVGDGGGGDVRWVEWVAHGGNAYGNSGIPVLGPYAVAVFPPGLRCQENNTTALIQAHVRKNKGNLAKHTHTHTVSVDYSHTLSSKTLRCVIEKCYYFYVKLVIKK